MSSSAMHAHIKIMLRFGMLFLFFGFLNRVFVWDMLRRFEKFSYPEDKISEIRNAIGSTHGHEIALGFILPMLLLALTVSIGSHADDKEIKLLRTSRNILMAGVCLIVANLAYVDTYQCISLLVHRDASVLLLEKAAYGMVWIEYPVRFISWACAGTGFLLYMRTLLLIHRRVQ